MGAPGIEAGAADPPYSGSLRASPESRPLSRGFLARAYGERRGQAGTGGVLVRHRCGMAAGTGHPR